MAVPVVIADYTTATSISLSWTTSGSEGVSYTVVWQRDTSGYCSDVNEGSESLSGGSMTMYDIPQLEEDSTYSITVTATNTLGSEMSVAISANTLTAGKYWDTGSSDIECFSVSFSSHCCSRISDNTVCDLLHHHCPVGDGAMYPSEWTHHWLLSEIWSDGECEHTD